MEKEPSTAKEPDSKSFLEDEYSDDESEPEYPDYIRSVYNKSGLEIALEIEWPGMKNPSKLNIATTLPPEALAPMFDGTQWAGTRIWRASIVAIQYIAQEMKTLGNTTTLLELGCGLGVPGMVLHGLLDWAVVVSDKEPLPGQLQNNCQNNFPDTYKKRLHAYALDWSREGVLKLQQSVQDDAANDISGAFDVVLNCDCVYEPLYGESWKLLVETMDELLRINPKTVAITSLERRKADGVEKFLKALEESQHITRVEKVSYEDSIYPEIQIYIAYGNEEPTP